jgi:drug/metabolite transporter (DMT)-like permease
VHQSLIPILVAEIVLWGTVPFVESPIQIPQSGLVWAAIIWLGLLGSGVAFLLYFYLLHAIGPTRSSMVTYTFPITGIAMGAIFLNESLDLGLILGAVLVVGSLLIVNRR